MSDSKWNFIPLFLGILSFIYLYINAKEFISKFGNDIHVGNLFIDGYRTETMKVLSLIALTVVLLAITIYIATKIGYDLFAFIQIIISIGLMIWSLFLGWVPFFGTLILVIFIGFAIVGLFDD